VKAEVLELQTAKLATSYPMRFKTLLKWDPRTDVWLAVVPVLGPLCVRAAGRNEVLESTKKAIQSYVDRAAAGGPRIPPESYEEVLEVEVEVPLKTSPQMTTNGANHGLDAIGRGTEAGAGAAEAWVKGGDGSLSRRARRPQTGPLVSGRDQQGSRTPTAGRAA
jgi:predicted RNase H-like HicB family nuclease